MIKINSNKPQHKYYKVLSTIGVFKEDFDMIDTLRYECDRQYVHVINEILRFSLQPHIINLNKAAESEIIKKRVLLSLPLMHQLKYESSFRNTPIYLFSAQLIHGIISRSDKEVFKEIFATCQDIVQRI